MNARIPAEVFPPGEFVRDELEARGWTQTDLAEILGRPRRLVNEIIAGKKSITPETAQGLGEAFGTDPLLWLNIESAYRLALRRKAGGAIARRAKLFKYPIRDMIKRQWIEATKDVAQLETAVMEFFELESIDQEPSLHAARYLEEDESGRMRQ
jgi:HTH-type transcriptional regulator/antitoxin HigA